MVDKLVWFKLLGWGVLEFWCNAKDVDGWTGGWRGGERFGWEYVKKSHFTSGLLWEPVGRGTDGWVSWSNLWGWYVLQVVLLNLLTESVGKDRKAEFPAGVCKVSSTFTGIKIFSCDGCNGGVHYEFVLG